MQYWTERNSQILSKKARLFINKDWSLLTSSSAVFSQAAQQLQPFSHECTQHLTASRPGNSCLAALAKTWIFPTPHWQVSQKCSYASSASLPAWDEITIAASQSGQVLYDIAFHSQQCKSASLSAVLWPAQSQTDCQARSSHSLKYAHCVWHQIFQMCMAFSKPNSRQYRTWYSCRPATTI